MQEVAHRRGLRINPTNHPHAFPDIKADGFGVEVKSTRQDNWSAPANSILESMRDEDAVHHVRISHAPRFVVGMDTPQGGSLFDKIGVTYEEFARKTPSEKMEEVRKYARSRLQPGERLWWLEEHHAVDLEIRRFQELDDAKKRQVRAEAAALCPEIVGPARQQNKYDGALKFLVAYHGVLAARDMFTAGSVGAPDGHRGGGYMQNSLTDIQAEMITAFQELDGKLFEEYWPRGTDIPDNAEGRKRQWLALADEMAQGEWTPSDILFR